MHSLSDTRKMAESDGLTPDSVRKLSGAALDKFLASPSISTLVAHAVFTTLGSTFDDDSSVVTEACLVRRDQLLQNLLGWLRTEESLINPSEMKSVAVSLAEFVRSIP